MVNKDVYIIEPLKAKCLPAL